MDLFDAIARRKSCRRYTGTPLGAARLDEIRDAIGRFERLYADVALDTRFATETRGPLNIKAPHYLIVSGQGAEREAESAGFVFEQLALWFDLQDIGCVWLGKVRDVAHASERDIITLAFGEPDAPVHRDLSAFTRKPIAEITNAPEDACIRAARLAPSGMNLQPWYFEKTAGAVLVYRQRLRPPVSLVYKKTDVDMGIALCHYMLACRHDSRPFAFARKSGAPEKKGYELFGEIR